MTKITIPDDEIIEIVEPLLRVAEQHAEGLANIRERCDNLYDRKKFGNEMEGFSQYVAATVFDTIEWLKPGMVDIFTHPDFFTVSMEDTDRAEKNKKLLRHQIFNQQPGAKVFRDYVNTALKYHNGVLKCFFDEDYNEEQQTFEQLPIEAYQQLANDPNIEIIKAQQVNEVTGEQRITYFEDVKILRRVEKYRGPRIISVAPEDFLYTPDGQGIDEFSLVAHRQPKTLDEIRRGERAGLYAKGSANKLVDGGETDMDTFSRQEKERRVEVDNEDALTIIEVDFDEDGPAAANKVYYVDEIYVRIDCDGDGLLEDMLIRKSGDVILNKEINPYGRPPFRAGCLMEREFRFEGQPLPMLLEGDQREMSNLRRLYVDCAADSAYGTMISDDAAFLDDWSARGIGDVVLKTGKGDYKYERPPQPNNTILQAMEMVRGDFERTSGVNSLNQGLMADNMGKTAAGTIALQNAGQQRQKLFATILGEPLKEVLKDCMWINRTWPPSGEITILGREALLIDPQDLDGDADVSIDVGVSPNDRMEKIQRLETHFQKLAQIMIPAGGAGIEHLLATERKIGKLSGYSVDDLQYTPEDVNSIKQMQQQMQQMQQQLQQMQQPQAMPQGMAPQGAQQAPMQAPPQQGGPQEQIPPEMLQQMMMGGQ